MHVSICLDPPGGDLANLLVVVKVPRGAWWAPAEGGVVAGAHGALMRHDPEEFIRGAMLGGAGGGGRKGREKDC